ncbi:hypothetical protein BAE44_0006530, partial [Dichanthelium oligosanthes]
LPLLCAKLPIARLQAHVPLSALAVDGYEAEAVVRLTLIPSEISFPCGRLSLRFFIWRCE